MSQNKVIEYLNEPEVLEQAYQQAPGEFEQQLKEAIEQQPDSETLRVWNARLSYSPLVRAPKFSIGLLVAICLIAGALTKMPSYLPIDGDWFYPRFVPLIVICSVMLYFLVTTAPSRKIQNVIMAGVGLCAFYMGILPENYGSASVTMALIHLPMVALSLLALSFMSDQWNRVEPRLNFIRYLGEMGIYSLLILLGGILLTAITLGLFGLIGLSIERWYMEYVVVLGMVSSPLVATYLFDAVQHRQGKLASILANVFSPLFLITVLVYLVATLFQGKSPFTDREFLITFNGLLITILALTIFSVSGKKRAGGIGATDFINVSLIGATLLVNVVALTAILFRWIEYGISVNRVVVTGVNILIFVHLILLLWRYVCYLWRDGGLDALEQSIAKYLPVYTIWSLIVSIILPLVFWFR